MIRNHKIDAHGLHLAPFKPGHAAVVVGWVWTEDELRRLAPSTPPPLTAEKVSKWRKVGGEAFVAFEDGDSCPVAYGELNPMRYESGHVWLGHVIVDPARRGMGIGRRFVESLLHEAFFERAARKVSLIVFPDNTAAVRCYESIGFCRAGEEHHRFATGGPLQRLLRLEIACVRRGG
ncbi:MAG: GNAT family N-acetyltransferase [Phycisphaerales bacterium]|nr:GNAT family N-acetyltransferase [Phycisphaerales bacterium]